MSQALETAAASDFTMVRDSDNQNIQVKSAVLDSTDKTKVTLTVYNSLTDAKTYTVTYTASDEAKTQSTAQVTVTDGVVADVDITPTQITVNTAKVIYYRTLDANGVVINKQKIGNPESKVTVSWDDTFHGTLTTATSELTLYSVGDTAVFKVTYNPGSYDTNGNAQGVITKEFTVTAVEDASVISQYEYTVATEKPFSWSSSSTVHSVALDDSTKTNTERYAYFRITNDEGEDVTSTCGYSVESADNTIVVADGKVKEGALDTTDTGILITPVRQGTTYLLVRDKDDKVVATLPIEVKAKRVLTKLQFSSASVTISTGASFDAAKGYVDVTALDQYDEAMSVSLEITDPANTYGASVEDLNKDGKVLCASSDPTKATAKNGVQFTVKATSANNTSMTRTLTINLQAPGDKSANSYDVVFLKQVGSGNRQVVTKVDTTISEGSSSTAQGVSIGAVVVVKNGGVVIKEAAKNVTVSAITVKSSSKTYFSVVSGAAGKPVTGTSSSAVQISTKAAMATGLVSKAALGYVNINVVSRGATKGLIASGENGVFIKTLPIGKYVVEFAVNGADASNSTARNTLEVVDTQTAVTSKVLATASESETLQSILTNKDYIEYYYGDVKISNVKLVDVNVQYNLTSNNKNIYVESVVLDVVAASSKNTFQVTVPVGKSFTTTRSNGWQSDFSN
jgi:hypothetical protein